VKLYTWLIEALARLAAVILGAMALLVTLDVVARNTGLGTIAWVNEVSEYSLPVATLLVAPWLLHRNDHVRLDVLLVSLPARLARALARITDLLGIAICAVFVWYSLRLIADSISIGSMVVKTLAIPEWWQYALVPVAFALLAVEFARRLRG
jgi:TRAP-type C4-dicarboxylate transport system permease small subunit